MHLILIFNDHIDAKFICVAITKIAIGLQAQRFVNVEIPRVTNQTVSAIMKPKHVTEALF